MTHPHKAMLDEFAYALDHLAPTAPKEIASQGRQRHTALSTNPESTVEQIHDALVTIGKQEFPYRKAYQEMIDKTSDARRVELVLEHLEPEVKNKVQHLLDSAVTLEALTKSSIFETDFTAEERYQIEDGILHADEHIKEELPATITKKQAEYDKLVKSWKDKQSKMQEKIEELRVLANKDPKWQAEILDKVKTLEEGWSVVERDPELLEIEKEIEYWTGTIAEDV